jgi:hypothetical protein
MKNMDFEQGTIGPFPFYSATISPDSKAFIDVPLPSTVNPGNWKIFVSASQGNVTETREFEKSLTFTNRFDFLGAAIRGVVIVFGFVLAFWAYRILRPRGTVDDVLNRVVKRTGRSRNQLSKETEDLIAELRAKAEASELKVAKFKKDTGKKSPVTKSSKKKTPTKTTKTSSKLTKKTTTKKAAPKKKATKKAATKKR